MSDDLTTRLAEDAFSACRADFSREQGRPLSDDEEGIARRTAELAVEWSATQTLERLLPTDERTNSRRRRKLNKREERRRVTECKRYVKSHWNDPSDGYGFILSLISAVIFHLIVVLIVRFILKKFIDNQALAAEVCKG